MKHVVKHVVAAAAMAMAAMPAAAETLVVDVAGAQSNGVFNAAASGNTIRLFNIGAGARLTAVAFSVNITAYDPSLLSQTVLYFTNTDLTEAGAGAGLVPGVDSEISGTGTFSFSLDLAPISADFAVGADGILRLEWAERVDDLGVEPDARWNSGTVTFTYEAGPVLPAVPEPATWALMIVGAGAVGGMARYRRGKTGVAFA